MVDGTKARSWRNTLSVLAIFSLGIVFGFAIAFAIAHHLRPGPFGHGHGPHHVERMMRDLDLDADQQVQVRAILERRHATMRALLEEARLEIRTVLRPDQQERFDRMRPPAEP